VLRLLDRSPLENPKSLDELSELTVPLLLNLPPQDFEKALEVLQPAAMDERLSGLASKLYSGSPSAQFQLEMDPTGLTAAAIAPVAGSSAVQMGDPLVSEDELTRIIQVTTRQENLSTWECRALMDQVNAFLSDFRARHWESNSEVSVTGRSAFVAEISHDMRRDLLLTMAGSLVLITLLFLTTYRSLRLLVSVVSVLFLSCLLSLAAGAVVFGTLNVITIGFCSILVGLGVDFGMLLFTAAQQSKAKTRTGITLDALKLAGPGIVLGSVTTSAAFLAMVLSDSVGFTQLGVLVAIGVLCCAGAMMVLIFPLAGVPRSSSVTWLERASKALSGAVLAHPRRFLAVALVCAVVFVVLPLWHSGTLARFDASPASLEPRSSSASRTYHEITRRMPSSAEPIIVLIEDEKPIAAARTWKALHARWTTLHDQGALDSFTDPAPLLLSPTVQRQNAGRLDPDQLAAARQALVARLNTLGIDSEGLAGRLDVLDRLAEAARNPESLPDWKTGLPAESKWWFVLDRYLGLRPGLSAGYLVPAKRIEGEEAKEAFVRAVIPPELPAKPMLSGWSFTLLDLMPWARRELLLVSSAVGGAVALLLALAYRRFELWFAQITGMAAGVGMMLGLLHLFGISLNLLNVLAFPLVLGVGVDYGIHLLLAVKRDTKEVAHVLKPILLCGLTTLAGFGSLVLARNPSLQGLGAVSACGVLSMLVAAIAVALPMGVMLIKRQEPESGCLTLEE
jgi:predicted exporter